MTSCVLNSSQHSQEGLHLYSDLEWALFALPARLGGLGITIPSKQADQEHQSSLLITSALYDHIISQDEDYGYDIIAKQLESKATVRQQTKEKNSKDAHDLTALLSDSLRRSVNLAKEKGSSSWLTALPLTEHGSMHPTQRSLPCK